jgi:TRAP-type C4-dicarboxylate transport system permease small subunit
MTYLAASATMREGGMVRVGMLVSRASPRVRRALDAFCVLCGIATMAIAAGFVAREMWQSFERGYETDSLVALPSWLPPLPLLLGMLAFVLDMVVHFVAIATGRATLPDDAAEPI